MYACYTPRTCTHRDGSNQCGIANCNSHVLVSYPNYSHEEQSGHETVCPARPLLYPSYMYMQELGLKVVP